MNTVDPSQPDSAPPGPADHGAPRATRPPSIRDFLTDGSLARLCDEMARLTGVPIWLRDIDGRVIAPADAVAAAPRGPITPGVVSGAAQRLGQAAGADAPLAAPMWRILDAQAGAARAYALVGKRPEGAADLFVAPLRTSLGDIGSIVMPVDWGRDDPAERRALERAVTLLASTGAESCEGALALQRRVHELDAMFRLSSLLVQATDPDNVLSAALDLALEVLGLDAGTISVLDEQGDLVHQAARNLSDAWLRNQAPYSVGGALRREAMEGGVIVVEDLAADPRIADHARPAAERLASLIGAGLVYQGRPAGMIRLYSRSPRTFTEADLGLLRSIADHAAMALAYARLRRLREEDQIVQRQIRVAADVQRRMLPRNLPLFARFDLAAKYAPSYQLGGDFYDLFDRRGTLGMVVGDVVGKGVPAALLMSAVRASFRAHAAGETGLDEIMARLNAATFRDTLESEFVTLWSALLDPTTLTATCCSAGHDPALIFRPGAGGAVDLLDLGADGMALGIDPAQTYTCRSLALRPGDLLVAYTDGLSDASDFQNNRFGRAGVRDTIAALLRAEPGAGAARVVEHVVWTLRQFSGLRLSTDDLTLVAVRVR